MEISAAVDSSLDGVILTVFDRELLNRYRAKIGVDDFIYLTFDNITMVKRYLDSFIDKKDATKNVEINIDERVCKVKFVQTGIFKMSHEFSLTKVASSGGGETSREIIRKLQILEEMIGDSIRDLNKKIDDLETILRKHIVDSTKLLTDEKTERLKETFIPVHFDYEKNTFVTPYYQSLDDMKKNGAYVCIDVCSATYGNGTVFFPKNIYPHYSAISRFDGVKKIVFKTITAISPTNSTFDLEHGKLRATGAINNITEIDFQCAIVCGYSPSARTTSFLIGGIFHNRAAYWPRLEKVTFRQTVKTGNTKCPADEFYNLCNTNPTVTFNFSSTAIASIESPEVDRLRLLPNVKVI